VESLTKLELDMLFDLVLKRNIEKISEAMEGQ